MTVLILATLDTKGRDADFVRDTLRALGVEVALVDTGCLGDPEVSAGIPREQLFAAAGMTIAAIRARADRGEAVAAAARGAAAIVRRWPRKVGSRASLASAAARVPRSARRRCARCRSASRS